VPSQPIRFKGIFVGPHVLSLLSLRLWASCVPGDGTLVLQFLQLTFSQPLYLTAIGSPYLE
jgi:hypothetical protein